MTRAVVSRSLIFVFLCVGFAGASAAADLLAPTSLAATAVSSSQINLSWVESNANETAITVQRSLSAASGFVTIANLAKNSTSYSNTGLAAGTTYYYRVQAVGRKGIVSPFSNVAGATTGASVPTPTAAATRRRPRSSFVASG